MQLITNNNTKKDHLYKIKNLIETSEVIILCTGWMNKNGIKKIIPSLKIALCNNSKITIYSNKKNTTSHAKKDISKLNNIQHSIVSKKYLHSKIYYFELEKTYKVIIGSANLTEGALSTNEELSVEYSGVIGDKNNVSITNYLSSLKKLC